MSGLLVAVVWLAGCESAGGQARPVGTDAKASATAAIPSRPVARSASPGSELSGTARPSGSSAPPVRPTFADTTVPLAPGVSDEASGIVASSSTPGAYFLIDDGTGDGVRDIAAVGTNGHLIARVAVDGMSAVDPEALAAGSCGATPPPGSSSAKSCLYIGDIGDNNAVRADIAIFRIAEPDLVAAPSGPVPADEWRYQYPDGPHNAEGLLVQADGSLLVVTKPAAAKGNLPHRMYLAEPGGGELRFVREFAPPPAQRPLRTLFTGNVVTDLGSGPGRVLLLTYDEAQEYVTPNSAAALSSFPDWPHHRLPMPALPQAEGITPMIRGCGYAIASEAGPGGAHGWLSTVSCG